MAAAVWALWLAIQLAACAAKMTASSAVRHALALSASTEQSSYLNTLNSLLQGCQGLECMTRYVEAVDPVYSWGITGKVRGVDSSNGVGYTVHFLNMTSQRWLTPRDCSASVWWHPIAVAVPANLEATDWATLVAGGANAKMEDFIEGTTPADWMGNADVHAAINFATRTKAVAVALGMVPNQAMILPYFNNDQRVEDSIKAYTWAEFLDEHGERPEWPLEMPNAKAVVRGMDTVTAFTETLGLAGGACKRFAVTGCSKRGMAAYNVAAVDSRVKAIMPGVISPSTREMTKYGAMNLNAAPFLMHDYLDAGVSGRLWGPDSEKLLDIIDPLYYMEKFAGLPKFAMFAGNDDIFGPDGDRVFWEDLPEPKSFLAIPNLGHQGSTTLANFLPSAADFVRGLVTGTPEPKLDWTLDNTSGIITARQLSNHSTPTVFQWTAVSCNGERRDFRFTTADAGAKCAKFCGKENNVMRQGFALMTGWTPPGYCEVAKAGRYQPTPVLETAPGSREWKASVQAASGGRFTATFLTFTYPGDVLRSTQVMVYPDTFPFPSCEGEGCQLGGRIV